MKDFIEIIKSDFKNFIKYNILQIVIILSLLLASMMAFITSFDPLIFIYITVFILPVIIFATNFFIEAEEKTLIPMAVCKCPSIIIMAAKLASSLVLLLIPFILDTLVMIFILNMHINVILFFLIYILAASMHIIIGIVLAIISKSSSIMSMSYVAYIVIFSLIPIFYTSNLIPNFFQYVLVISPAYLSGVLFQEVYFGYAYSPDWLIITAVVLQIAYIIILTIFLIRPFFKSYILFSATKEGKSIK